MEARDVALQVSPEAYTWMLAQNDHPEWGARPLRRIIRRYLREPLADFLLAAEPEAGTCIQVGANEEGLTFRPTEVRAPEGAADRRAGEALSGMGG